MKNHVVGTTPLAKRLRRRVAGNWWQIVIALGVIGLVATVGILTNQTSVYSARSADLNGDGTVNVQDLSILLAHWGAVGGDINNDGTTNVVDLSILLTHWNTTVPTPSPTSTVTPTVTPSATDPSGEAMPVGDLPGWHQTLAENFARPASSGTGTTSFKSVYANSWCGYNENQGGYFDNEVLSAHDGLMDFSLDGTLGAAGSFGPVNGSCSGQLYGRYTIRFKAVDATGYGGVIFVWPNGDVWGNGEMDFPEGDYNSTFNMNQHGINCTDCSTNIAQYKTGVTWTNWHTATTEWTASGVSYYLDGKLLTTVTQQVPIMNHRYTIQMKPTSTPATSGHLLIDWVSIYTQQ